MQSRTRERSPRQPVPVVNENDFVLVDDGSDGFGKLVRLSDGLAEIEYFVSPAGPVTHRVSVPEANVRKVELPSQTRVFWYDAEDSAWRIGRVDGGLVSAQALRANEDHYHVRFPNRQDGRIPCSQLYTRWAHPIEDPADHLAARITESPLFYDGRRLIVQHLASQRAAFGGLTALASSAVELFEHQVTTVRRVLSDPVQRYLLADEVGLGKTIEAGVLIRQHVLDQPRQASVLVVVPPHLADQWQRELERKFFLTLPKPIRVLTEQEIVDGFGADDDYTMLVVDEAHRAAAKAFSSSASERRLYERLRAVSKRVPRVLLLSATPVLHHEDGFLAMLHLIDPDAYRLEDREAFRRRVRERQTVAEAAADLSDDASSLFAEEAIDRLVGAFADDPRLIDLAAKARVLLARPDVDVERRQAIGRVRRHLVESYRLHRRLLRTRRDDPRVSDLLPSRTSPLVLSYEDPAREEAGEAIETWRRLCLDQAGSPLDSRVHRLFTGLVERALSHPRALLETVRARLASLKNEDTASRRFDLVAAPPAFAGELEFWEERVPVLAAALTEDARAKCLSEWLATDGRSRKVVVFCDECEDADALARVLRASLGDDAVGRHGSEREVARSFEGTDSLRVLICDGAAEEGLNLQRVGAVIVHYDLPLESTRIEQRIGRVDRLEAARNVRTVLFSAGTRYEREWLDCLLKAIRVFERSIAPLQYALLESTSRVRAALLEEGAAAIEAEQERLQHSDHGLEAEMRRIRSQEALDSIDENPDEARAFFEELVRADASAETNAPEAFDGWLVKRLQFARRQNGPIVQYVHLSGSHRQTLTPAFDAATRFHTLVDRSAYGRRGKGELPLVPFTFDRAAAEKEGLPLLRAGHPFVSAIEAMMRADDRGAAFALWRVIRARGLDTPRLFLRFDFVIEVDIARADSVIKDYAGLTESLRRRADAFFPVQYRTVWLNSDLGEVRHAQLLEVLQRPYRPKRDGGTDVNLRPDRWSAVDSVAPIADWHGLCVRARRHAEDRLRSSESFIGLCRTHAERVRTEAAAVQDVFRSRIARLSGSAKSAEEEAARLDDELGQYVAAGIESPTIRVDAAGVIFLSASPLPEGTA